MKSQRENVAKVISDIFKSPKDKRLYRGLELTNEMKVLLVSDPSTDISAAALTVNVGYLNDPWEMPGLAHFCEHMLTKGTDTYPQENDYQQFLSSHGGDSNAYTATESTCYHFDVAPEFLEGALDRFSQFFICPLFTESATEREVNAIDSENAKNLKTDIWRMDQLQESLSDPSHAYHKFGTGSKETLMVQAKEKNLEPRTALLKFHEAFYSSNLMGVCVLGKESLDQLEEIVVSRFSIVKNKKLPKPEWPEHPYGKEQLGRRVQVVPVKDIRRLRVIFPISDLQTHYKSAPQGYVSHLIGHEGTGSLLSELKTKGLASMLYSGARMIARGFGFFIVEVDLNKDAEEQVDEIIQMIFEYIHMLKSIGPQEWIHRECQNLRQIPYLFQDKQNPSAYVTSISADLLRTCPMEEVLFEPMTEYKPEIINELLARLTPDNMVYFVVSHKFEGKTNNVEKWCGAKYNLDPVSQTIMDKLLSINYHNAAFSLPAPNELIPTEFNLHCGSNVDPSSGINDQPELLEDCALSRIWFLQDREYQLPKCCCYFAISSPCVYATPFNHNLSMLYAMMVDDAMSEYVYDADRAGLYFDFSPTIDGMEIEIEGYDEKQHTLLQKLVDKMATLKPDPKQFEVSLEQYIRGLKNFKMNQPHSQSLYYAFLLLSDKNWSKDELLEATEGLTVEKLEGFISLFLSSFHIEALIHGNATKQTATGMVEMIHKRIEHHTGSRVKPLFSSQLSGSRGLELPNGKSFVFQVTNEIHSNSAIKMYLQCGTAEIKSNMLLELLHQIMKEPIFEQLRRKEQLGYIVRSSMLQVATTQGLQIIIQSDRSPEFLESRIENFLKDFLKLLQEQNPEEWEKHKASLASQRLVRYKKLTGLADEFWTEITEHTYNFNRDNIEVDSLRTITKEQLIDFFKDVIDEASSNRKKLTIYVEGTKAKEDKTRGDELLKKREKIEDISAFKEAMSLGPSLRSSIDLPERGARARLYFTSDPNNKREE